MATKEWGLPLCSFISYGVEKSLPDSSCLSVINFVILQNGASVCWMHFSCKVNSFQPLRKMCLVILYITWTYATPWDITCKARSFASLNLGERRWLFYASSALCATLGATAQVGRGANMFHNFLIQFISISSIFLMEFVFLPPLEIVYICFITKFHGLFGNWK